VGFVSPPWPTKRILLLSTFYSRGECFPFPPPGDGAGLPLQIKRLLLRRGVVPPRLCRRFSAGAMCFPFLGRAPFAKIAVSPAADDFFSFSKDTTPPTLISLYFCRCRFFFPFIIGLFSESASSPREPFSPSATLFKDFFPQRTPFSGEQEITPFFPVEKAFSYPLPLLPFFRD